MTTAETLVRVGVVRGRSWRGKANRRGREAEDCVAHCLHHNTAVEVRRARRNQAATATVTWGSKREKEGRAGEGREEGSCAAIFAKRVSMFVEIAL